MTRQPAHAACCDHIGVDWEPQVLDFHTLERPVKTASVWQVRQPLYASSKARWQRYEQHLEPLIDRRSKRTISWDPIEMVTLPEPGLLNVGVDRYHEGDLDAAEYRFKRLLHYVPEHAAARFMLGLDLRPQGPPRRRHLADGAGRRTLSLERPLAPRSRARLSHGRPESGRAGTGPYAGPTRVAPPPNAHPAKNAPSASTTCSCPGNPHAQIPGPRLLARVADQLPAVRYGRGRWSERCLAGDAAQSPGRGRPGGGSGRETPRGRCSPQPTLPHAHRAGTTVRGRRALVRRGEDLSQPYRIACAPADLGVRAHRQQHCRRGCRGEHGARRPLARASATARRHRRRLCDRARQPATHRHCAAERDRARDAVRADPASSRRAARLERGRASGRRAARRRASAARARDQRMGGRPGRLGRIHSGDGRHRSSRCPRNCSSCANRPT